MIARISPWRISKLIAVERANAAERQADVLDLEQHLTDPPRRRGHCRAIPHAACRPVTRNVSRRADLQIGADDRGAAILERHLRLDRHRRAVGIQRRDQRAIAFGDGAPAHLARAGQLAIIGIQLLVQDQEASDLRTGQRRVLRQVAIHRGDVAGDQLIHLVAAGEVGIAGIGDAAPLGPVADRIEIDVDEAGGEIAPVAERDRLLDIGEELELVLQIFRREQRAVVQPADILGPIDDAQMAALGEHARIAGVHPAVRRLGRRRRLGILVIADEHAGAAVHDLAVLGDLHLDPGRRRAGGIRPHVIVRLQTAIGARFRLAVELLQIDAE